MSTTAKQHCDATDTCNSAIAKLQAWITNGAIRSNYLYGDFIKALANGQMSPLSYRNHMDQLRNTNRHIITCWIIVKEKCKPKCPSTPTQRQLPARPYIWKVPSEIPKVPIQHLPWWVPSAPAGDTTQNVWITIGIGGVVLGGWLVGGALVGGGAAGGAAAGGATTGAGAAAGAATIISFPSAATASELIAAGLLISLSSGD